MIYVLVAAVGMLAARYLSWPSLIAIATILAIAVGVEGAVEARSLFKTLKRGLEINLTFQGAYLAAVAMTYAPRLLGRIEK